MKSISIIITLLLAASVYVLKGFVFTNQGAADVEEIQQFVEVTAQVGLQYRGMSYGAACGDVDGDSHCDIYAPRHFQAGVAALLKNSHGTFIDISAEIFGEPDVDRVGDRHSALFADIDDDGDQDLAVATGANYGTGREPCKVFLNTEGRLIDSAAQLGLAAPLHRGRGFLFVDVNGDERLDAVLAAHRRAVPRLGHTIYLQRPVDSACAFSSAPDAWKFTDDNGEFVQLAWLPGIGSVLFAHGWPCHLFAIREDGLEDITEQVGLHELYDVSDSTWADFDGDGDLDLYCGTWTDRSDVVINQRGEVECELVNNGSDPEVRITPAQSSDEMTLRVWGVDATEIRIGSQGKSATSKSFSLNKNDATGLLDPTVERSLHVGFNPRRNCWRLALSSKTWARAAFVASYPSGVSRIKRVRFQPAKLQPQDRIYFWEGEHFVGRIWFAGVPVSATANVAAADFDCDGDMDIYLVCSTGVRNFPNMLLENDGGGRFTVQKSGAGAPGSADGCGDAVALLDYDNDGGLDLFLSNGEGDPPFCEDGPEQLYRNVGQRGHWLGIDLVGKGLNRDAIGARVTVVAGGRNYFRLQDGGVHYRAQNHPRLHFGLGTADTVSRVDVVWPDGVVQRIGETKADRVIQVRKH